MISLNPHWAWKALILLPLVPFLIWFVSKKIQSNYKLQQDIFSELTRFTEEQISGIRVVKGFGLEKVRLKMYEEVSKRLEKQSFKTSVFDAVFMPIMELSATFGGVILLFVAYPDVLAGTATVGTFIAFHRYIMKMVWPMTAFGLGISYWQKGMASFKRVKEVLEEQTDTPDSGALVLREFNTLEFKNVSFQYPGSSLYALKDLNFKISKGEKLAILGPIGAGKSTLISLVLRLFPLIEGEILINGVRHTEYSLESLRKTIQLVPQEPFLFGRSVFENVMMGQLVLENPQDEDSEKLDRRLWSELQKFQIADEVEKLPEREKALLGEKGVNLSGGQKQRLTLARAYAGDPHLMILDDVLSAVDTETEKKISEGLFASKNMTYLIIAHRLSTVQNTDKVLVLRSGELEYFGAWDQAFARSHTLTTFLNIQKDPHAEGGHPS
jgi:ATP-binding cassette subfamily B protein